jgi:hypothetical protein
MNGYDLGALIVAVRAVLPTAKLKDFDDMLLRAATSPCASDDLRFAVGLEPRGDEPSGPGRKFKVIPGDLAG